MNTDTMAGLTSGMGISVVIPVYQNQYTLTELAERLVETLLPLRESFELVFVNDASPDNSLDVLTGIKNRYSQIKLVDLNRNLGQQNAIREGLRASTGDVIVVMDGDLQDAPEAIGDLYQALKRDDHEAVFTQRTEDYQGKRRMMSSRLFKWLVNKMVGLPRGTGCYLIMSRRMLNAVFAFDTRRFYLPGLVAKTRFPIGTIPSQRNRRSSGQSSYNTSMRLNVAIANIRCLLERK